MSDAARSKLRDGIVDLPRADKRLVGGLIGVSVLALAIGIVYALFVVSERAGFIDLGTVVGYQLLTGHAVSVFYYWLYFVQAAIILILIRVYTDGAEAFVWRRLAWLGFVVMTAGFVINEITPVLGAAVLYTATAPLSGQFPFAAYFYLGYLALAVGLLFLALSAIRTALEPKLTGQVDEWSSITFAGVLWWGLVIVSLIASVNVYLPAAQWTLGLRPLNFNYEMSWAVLFHNMHYLPLMSTVLVWYALAEATTGVKSIYSDRFSKGVFALYLVFVPPTSLYHLFLSPGIPSTVKAAGSFLALMISVPTVLVFLVIVTSLEASARGSGEGGVFGWVRSLPWRNPAFAAVGMSVVSAAAGGVLANVLIQHEFAGLLSDTFFVPAYFHFFTVGTVSLTFLGALVYVVPTLVGHRLWRAGVMSALPYVLTVGVYLFGTAGMIAGYLGVPRRTFDVGYGGSAPPSWGLLMAVVGIGGIIMVVAIAVYVVGLALTAHREIETGLLVDEFPVAQLRVEDATGQSAWSGIVATVILIAGWFVFTAITFGVMNAPSLGG